MDLSQIISDTVDALGVGHFDRPSGSRIVNSPENIPGLLSSLSWDEVTDGLIENLRVPGCRYFEAHGLEMIGIKAVCAAVHIDRLSAKERETIRKRIGHHGNEEMVSLIPVRAAHFLTLIVGPHEGKEVVWTWFPGPVLPPEKTVKLEWSE